MENSAALFPIFISPPFAEQHKPTYGLALNYPMANIREVSALGGKKKAGVSAGVKSEVTAQQQMQKRGEEDCALVGVNNCLCAMPQTDMPQTSSLC